MPSFIINIPIKMPSWNAVARKHYRVYQKIFDGIKMETAIACRSLTWPKFVYPVEIDVTCYWKYKMHRDIDSVLFKPILDTIVSKGYLKDDSLEYVSSVTYTGKTGAHDDSVCICIKYGSS